jgi:hypothetical protein
VVDILMPYAESASSGEVALAPRLSRLDAATIGVVNNSWRCMHVITDELTTRLTTDFGVSEILEERVSAAQTLPDDLLDAMAGSCDAVVVGIGN